MPPQSEDVKVITEKRTDVNFKRKDNLPPREYHFLWHNIIMLGYIQIGAIYGAYLIFTEAKIKTTIFTVIIWQLSVLGASVGAHRLWAHKSFKAKTPLKIILVFLQAIAFQESAYTFAKNHRLHHKYPDDDADPYNPARGYFYAHIGWFMVKKHPRSVEKGRQLNIDDLLSDPILMFQKKYYWYMVVLFSVIMPTIIPMYFWGETFICAWYLNTLRHNLGVHAVACTNSVAHNFGKRPYDIRIGPANYNLFNLVTAGEGAHNYHHVFPWDYRSIEMGTFYFNFSTWFIDLMAKIGWAYDLKSASMEMVEKRILKTGNMKERPQQVRT